MSAPPRFDVPSVLEYFAALVADDGQFPLLEAAVSIAQDDSGVIGSIARIRAGWVLAADGPRADLDATLAPLTDPTDLRSD